MATFSRKRAAEFLEAALRDKLPDAYRVAEEDGAMAFYVEDEWSGTIWFGDDEHFEDEQELESRLDIALSSIQDSVVHEIHGAWPARIPEHGMPMPWARIESEVVKVGFGDVEFDSIALEALRAHTN